MTGYISKEFRHRCETKGCYVQQLPPWDDLIESFPRGIRPTDVDGLVEINGWVLVLEEKSAGKSMENGQRHALKVLSRKLNTTVVVFRPVGDGTDDQEVLFLAADIPLPHEGYSRWRRADLKAWISHWARCADAQSWEEWQEQNR